MYTSTHTHLFHNSDCAHNMLSIDSPHISTSSCFQLPNPLLNIRHRTELQLDILLLTVRKLASNHSLHHTLINLLFKHRPPLCIQLPKVRSTLPIELQYPRMIFPQTPPMTDCHERDAQPFRLLVHDALDL